MIQNRICEIFVTQSNKIKNGFLGNLKIIFFHVHNNTDMQFKFFLIEIDTWLLAKK